MDNKARKYFAEALLTEKDPKLRKALALFDKDPAAARKKYPEFKLNFDFIQSSQDKR